MKINWALIGYILGLLLMVEAGFMLLASGVGVYYHYTLGETDWQPMLLTSAITMVFGVGMWYKNRVHTAEITTREGFFIVSVTWIVFTLFGMLPFLFTGALHGVTDAFLETMAGFTTTGCTVMTDIDNQPHALLFWRNLTQWLGGLGIVVVSLALLPRIGTGATQIFGAETNGLQVDKLRPRIQQTARRLWMVYLILSVANALLYWVAGMSVFDAVCHTFSTMASGGFSTHQDSLGHYHSPLIEYICCVFLFLTSINFTLFYAMGKGDFKQCWKNEEFRWFVRLVVFFTVLFMALNALTRWSATSSPEQIAALGDGSFECTLRTSLFHTLTIISSAGFQAEYFDYHLWGHVFWLPTLLMMAMGGCTCSTAGGLKVVRMVILVKNARNEFLQALNPHSYTSVRLNGHTLSYEIVFKVLALLGIYVIFLLVSIFFLQCLGLSFDTCIGTAVSALGNTGPALGATGPAGDWSCIPDLGKWYLSFCMLAGRLEIFTVILLFTPMFWKK